MRIQYIFAAAFLAALIGTATGAEPQLGSPNFQPTSAHPIGWRGDGTGRYPDATPPLEWYRRPKGAFSSLRFLAAKPKGNAAEGEFLNMGTIREWMIAGPFEAKDHATALEDVSAPNEPALQPAVGEQLTGKPWQVQAISVGNQSQSWARLVVDFALIYGKKDSQEWQNHPGTLEPFVAYACAYLYSPEATKVLLRISGSKVKAWFNDAPVKIPGQWEASPPVELRAGWNRILVKAASTRANWNFSSLITPAPGTAYDTKNIVWMAPMPGSSWCSPIVVGSKIFVDADEGTLVCLNKQDGRTLWTRSTTFYDCIGEEERAKFPTIAAKQQQLDEAMKALPDVLNSGLSADGSKSDENAALQKKIKEKVALERGIRESMGKTDKLYNCWENDRSWSMPTPVSDGKYVYVALYGGNKGIGGNVVACFDLDGKNIWRHFTGQSGIGEHGTHATPVLTGNNLIYLSGATLFCYEKETGKVVWQKKTRFNGVTGASPVALKAGSVDVVLVPEVGIFRTSDGAELWKSDLTHSIVTPFHIGGVILGVSEGNNKTNLYAMTLPPPTGNGDVLKPDVIFKKLWKEVGIELPGQFTNSIIGPPLYNEGLLYVATEGGGLAVVDAKTGAPIYSKALETLNPRLTWVFSVGICTGPTLAGKVIHIRDDQSQTLVLAPGPAYKELAKNVLWELQSNGSQQEAQSTPVYEGGRIYYRTQGFLYCIGEK